MSTLAAMSLSTSTSASIPLQGSLSSRRTAIQGSKVAVEIFTHLMPIQCSSSRIAGIPCIRNRRDGPPRIQAAAVEATEKESDKLQSGTWSWKYGDSTLKIYYEELVKEGCKPSQTILLLPTISDVSTTEEWKSVAKILMGQSGAASWRMLTIDWPGFGLSDRPSLQYTADMLETFLADLVNSVDGPVNDGKPPIILAGGHAATLTIRALKKDLIKAKAVAAVAPTWAGPMPIVFGRGADMQARYDILQGSLRAPGVGWLMYNFMVSSPKNIESQYTSHVYADPKNVTPALIESRTALTKREGARYAPASFLTGYLDPVESRDGFVSLFADMDGKIPVLVLSSIGSPKRSKAEMEALKGAKGVSSYVEIPGALLPQEEYPDIVSEKLQDFLNTVAASC